MFDLYFLISLIICVTIHEFCHSFMATYLGDPTPRYLGRLTLNPLAHLDPLGTIMLFFAGFGWGKPVPFNTEYLKNPRLDAALIAASGPFSNFFMALLFAIPYRFLFYQWEGSEMLISFEFLRFLKTFIELNIVLMIFNLLPLPPLDGSKIFSLLLPKTLIHELKPYTHTAYLILFTFIIADSVFEFHLLGQFILTPIVNFFWKLVIFSH